MPIGIIYEGLRYMRIRTRVFEMAHGKYHNMSDLAKAMGLSVSQVYRVREGKRGINEKFIVGAKMAFPEQTLDELFYLHADKPSENMVKVSAAGRYDNIVRCSIVPSV
jgi:D-Tyr-tRNAtyr deacylase